MTNQNHEKNEETPKTNYLMIKLIVMTYIIAVVLFSISGCKQAKDAPISHIYVIDIQHQVCAKRVILNKQTLSSRHVEDMPIENCDGFIALSAQEFLALRSWMRARQ